MVEAEGRADFSHSQEEDRQKLLTDWVWEEGRNEETGVHYDSWLSALGGRVDGNSITQN